MEIFWRIEMFREVKKIEETEKYVVYAYGDEGCPLDGVMRMDKENSIVERVTALPGESFGYFRFFVTEFCPHIAGENYPDEGIYRIT